MESNKIKVLYVDDEANNLISFKANFRRFYEIFTAQSAEEGKKILKNNEIHVLITDQRMPLQNGVQFLESIIKEFPLTIRIILTGYADLETVMDAINKGQIYKYILKPFDAGELKLTIDNAFDLYAFRKNYENSFYKFKELFENYNAAIFILSPEGFFQEINQFGLNLFNIKRSELAGINLKSIIEDKVGPKNLHELLLKKETVSDFPAKIKDKKGNSMEVLISISPVNENNILKGYQCLIRDVTQQKAMEKLVLRAIIETQENERIRIGKNIHDSLGQKLASVQLFIQGLAIGNENQKNLKILNTTKELVNNAINEITGICFNIMPKTLEVLGLKGAIKELARMNVIEDLLEFNVEVDEMLPRLNIHLEIAIFRIVQEFTGNAIKHGAAKKIDLRLKFSSNQIIITLNDNGIGFDFKKADRAKGIGLKNIRSRVKSYNGEVIIDSKLNVGTQMKIIIPIDSTLIMHSELIN